MSVPTLEATASIEDACAALDEYGVVVINDYASSETLAQLRADIYPQLEDTPFGEVADDLLGEEGVARRPFGNVVDQALNRGVGAQQLAGQCCGLGMAQWA